MTHEHPESHEQQVESFETILQRFAPHLHKICAVPLKLSQFRSAPGVKYMRGGEEQVGAHIALDSFQVNTTPEGNICYIETFIRTAGIHAVLSHDIHDGKMILDLYPPLGVKGKRTLILNQENVPQPVSYNGRGQMESEMIHAEHLAAIEEVFEKHVFPWVESLGNDFISGVVGLTSGQVRGATLAENGGMEEAEFEDPAGPYPQN